MPPAALPVNQQPPPRPWYYNPFGAGQQFNGPQTQQPGMPSPGVALPVPVPPNPDFFSMPPFLPGIVPGMLPSPEDISAAGVRVRDKAAHAPSFFNQPIAPGTPGGAFIRDLQQFGEGLTIPARGLQIIAGEGANYLGQGLGGIRDYFTGGYMDPRIAPPELQPSKELPAPGMPTNPQAPPGTDFAGGLDRLDGTTIIQGTLPPAPPKLQIPDEFLPDYSKADARLEAGRPKGARPPRGSELQSGLTGAAEAAAQFDPAEASWSQVLVAAAAGYGKGVENFRLRQEEAEIRAESENRQYELMRAGVEEQRAAAEAQAHYNRTKMELDLVQQNFENQFKMWQMNSPSIKVGDNGETIVQRRDEKGNIVIERSGFKDALQMQLQLAQAKGVAGKQGQYRILNRAIQTGNIPGVINALTLEELGANNEDALLPPGSAAQAMYQKKRAEAENQLMASGVGKDMFMLMHTRMRHDLLNEIISSSPELQAYRAQALGLGQNLLAPPQQPQEAAPPKPTFTRGGAFPLPN